MLSMYSDVVFPQNNEEEFILMAKKLNYGSLYLAYDAKITQHINNLVDKLNDLRDKTRFKISLALLVKPQDITKMQKYAELILCESSDKDRWVLENHKNILLYNLEYQKRNDFIHHRNSGLNQVLCTFAHKNNIQIGISFYSLLNTSENIRPTHIGRIRQNIRLCRKYKIHQVLGSFAESIYDMRSLFDLQSFGVILGMQPGEAKKAISLNTNL